MRITRIFEVSYYITEKYNGKNGNTCKGTKTIVAKDAAQAIDKAKASIKDSSYKDDETKKMVKVTVHDFDPINVSLLAETD